jgi:hypothetical protein
MIGGVSCSFEKVNQMRHRQCLRRTWGGKQSFPTRKVRNTKSSTVRCVSYTLVSNRLDVSNSMLRYSLKILICINSKSVLVTYERIVPGRPCPIGGWAWIWLWVSLWIWMIRYHRTPHLPFVLEEYQHFTAGDFISIKRYDGVHCVTFSDTVTVTVV